MKNSRPSKAHSTSWGVPNFAAISRTTAASSRILPVMRSAGPGERASVSSPLASTLCRSGVARPSTRSVPGPGTDSMMTPRSQLTGSALKATPDTTALTIDWTTTAMDMLSAAVPSF